MSIFDENTYHLPSNSPAYKQPISKETSFSISELHITHWRRVNSNYRRSIHKSPRLLWKYSTTDTRSGEGTPNPSLRSIPRWRASDCYRSYSHITHRISEAIPLTISSASFTTKRLYETFTEFCLSPLSGASLYPKHQIQLKFSMSWVYWRKYQETVIFCWSSVKSGETPAQLNVNNATLWPARRMLNFECKMHETVWVWFPRSAEGFF
jgi:transposase-like protein